MKLFIDERKAWVVFDRFYRHSVDATKKESDFKDIYDYFIPLIPEAFNPLVWGQELKYERDDNPLLDCILNLIAHFVEVGGKGLSFEYVMGSAARAYAGGNMNVTDPILQVTPFGCKFAKLHSEKFGTKSAESDDQELIGSDFTFEDSGECMARGYQLDLDVHILKKYLVVNDRGSINIHGLLFNGGQFLVQLKVGKGENKDKLAYKYKAKICKVTRTIKHNTIRISID